MIKKQTKKYTYAIDGHGTFEITVAKNKQKQDSSEITGIENFELTILGQKQPVPASKKFYVFDWQAISCMAIVNPSKHQKEYSLWLNDTLVAQSKKLNKQLNSIRTLRAAITFKNAIGSNEFKIFSPNGTEILSLVFEVFPQKMDYKSDYKAMMEDISRITNKLSHAVLADSYQKVKPKTAGFTSDTAWWFILDALFDDLIKSFEIIQRNPKHDIITDTEVQQIDRVKKPSSKNRTWLPKNTQYISENENDGIELVSNQYFSHALSLRKKIRYDNYENRFVKYVANQTLIRLIEFKKDLQKSSIAVNKKVSQKIAIYIGRLGSILMKSPFNEVSNFEKENYFSSTLTKAAGYKDFLQIYMLLQNGFEILHDTVFKINLKNIAELYEYWCYLKLADVVFESSNFQIKYQNVFGFKAGKFRIDLNQNQSVKMQFKNTENEEITLYFNKEFTENKNKKTSNNQQSTIAIQSILKEQETPFWLIFDANYHLNEAEKMMPISKDAKYQLELFKEAIHQSEYEKESLSKKTIKNKIHHTILYPPIEKEPEFNKSENKTKFFDSLPLLPSKSRFAENYLRNILVSKKTENQVEEFVGMNYKQFLGKRETFDKTVTIGALKKSKLKERLAYLEEKNIHYFPFVKNMNSRIYDAAFLLLTRSGSTESLLKKVKYWEILNKKELENTGITWNLRSEHYICFYLETDTEKIDTKQEIPLFNFRYTSLRGLHFFRKQQNNNALYITNESAYQLYTILQRKNTEFSMAWSDDDKDYTGIVFKLADGSSLTCSSGFPKQHYLIDDELKAFSNLLTELA